MESVIQQAASLGIAGLLFVMWWFERGERLQAAHAAQQSLESARRTGELNDRLIDVIQGNTAALVGLRDELRSQREEAPGWVLRLSQQIERAHTNPFAEASRAAERSA